MKKEKAEKEEICEKCGGVKVSEKEEYIEMTDEEFEIENAKAMSFVDDRVVPDLYSEMENKNIDIAMVWFSLFCHSIHVLKECGWTKESLQKEVNDHMDMDD